MRENKLVSVWKTFWFAVRIMPVSFLVMLFVGLMDSVLSVASVYLTRMVFAQVERCLAGESLSSLYGPLALYAVCFLLVSAHTYFYTRYVVQFRTITRFEGKVLEMLHQKSGRISNEMLEMPKAFAFIRQSGNARQILFRFVEICTDIVTGILQAVIVTVYISTFQVWFALFLPLAVIPPLLKLLYRARLWKKDYEQADRLQREEEEYVRAMVDETACKESRLTGAAELLTKKWTCSREERDRLTDRQSRKLFWLRVCLSLAEGAGNCAGFVISAALLCRGSISLSDFTAAIAAYGALLGSYRTLISMLGETSHYYQMTQPFFRYWNFPERGGEGETCALEREITLRDVSFSYPNQERAAIDHINLTIHKGETLAIVGENGAGKTTLVNLILGLYRPTSGKVLYDGVDLETIKEEEIHRRQSAVFQSFNRYKMTVEENVAIGDFEKNDREGLFQSLSGLIKDSRITGKTMLGKEFGGIDLSGGQWQQLACARGFYKDSGLLALDEATSAIDPLREKAMYDLFERELEGRTGIIVTHRLGAARLADRIIALNQGRIDEEGTHEELMEKDGLYAGLWREQAKAYETEN